MDDSAKILKVIQTFPELEEVMRTRKRWWLFDQIIPQISHWLKPQEILTCRQVCKQWSTAVDNMINNHPHVRAYDHENQVTGQVWMRRGLPLRICGLGIPLVELESPVMVTRFLQQMENHSNGRSPFVGRLVRVELTPQEPDMLSRVGELFQRFGQQVWYVELHVTDEQHPVPLHSLKELLDLLPSLKGLRLSVALAPAPAWPDFVDGDGNDDSDNPDSDDDDPVDNEDGEDHLDKPDRIDGDPEPNGPLEPVEEILEPCTLCLPALPHLETLEFQFRTLPATLVNSVLTSYSQQIRRLWLSIKYWRADYSNILPNLTELHLTTISSKERLINLLMSIQAPLLHTLWLLPDPYHPLTFDINADFLPWLKRFPLIHSLCLFPPFYTTPCNATLTPARNSIPSLKYMEIPDDFLHYNSDFLLCVPNLETLVFQEGMTLDRPQEPPVEPTLRIWDYIWNRNQTMYESNVWTLLPRLQKISLAHYPDDEEEYWFLLYNRDEYDHLNRNRDNDNVVAVACNLNQGHS